MNDESTQNELEKSEEQQSLDHQAQAEIGGGGEPIPGLVMGRHVFFEDADGTHAAIVAHVVNPSSGVVNLTVLHHDGRMYEKVAVAPDSLSGSEWQQGTWRWMFDSQPTALTPKSGQYKL